MISVEKALEILEANVPEPKRVEIRLEDALGMILFSDLVSPESAPRFTNSAMDGYAVRWSDCCGIASNGPKILQVHGESQAGVPFFGTVQPGEAIRISTGAMLPEGADSVVKVEDTEEAPSGVKILATPIHGQNVRVEGEEFKAGAFLFAKGTRVGPRELAMFAAVGVKTIPVYRSPRVSLLITGTELAEPDSELIKPYQIRDSNTIMLSSATNDSGAHLNKICHVEDDLAQTIQVMEELLTETDILLCSGGVSVGRHDHVKDAAEAVGFSELFWKIRQKPGKPLYVGRRQDTLLFGLPGNPVSAFMCFYHYVRPVLARLQGSSNEYRSMTARVGFQIKNHGNRTNFIRVKVAKEPNELACIKEIAQQGSHMLSSITTADGYIILEPGALLEPGELVEVALF
ncbi:MAG: molybdopterin molybdenumtransferase MoeA [Desulfobulbaceae bacterium]|nr:MAG: molybdopterin molybdenumtransferase MoeA [Desulfobulbaceae bacterium]